METRRPSGPPARTFLVEGYWPRRGLEGFSEAGERLAMSVARLRREGIAVRYVAGTLVPSDEVAYWVLDGASADDVALAFARADIPVDRTVAALELRPTRRARVDPKSPVHAGGNDVDGEA